MEAALGWERPAAWGLLTPDGDVVRANVRDAYLPGVALATVLGHCGRSRSEEHTSELQSRLHLVCRLLLEKKKSSATRNPPRLNANLHTPPCVSSKRYPSIN